MLTIGGLAARRGWACGRAACTGADSTKQSRVLQFICKPSGNGMTGQVSVAFSAPAFTVPKWRNWQTRMVQVHVLARVWGFESLLRHHRN